VEWSLLRRTLRDKETKLLISRDKETKLLISNLCGKEHARVAPPHHRAHEPRTDILSERELYPPDLGNVTITDWWQSPVTY
jgi:hypothetical protein